MRGSFGRLCGAAALAALVTAFAGCSKPATTSVNDGGRANAYTHPHELRIGDTQNFDTLNPHLAASTTLGWLTEMTMAYLVRYGPHNEPEPELATEVPTRKNGGISSDGKTITWHIRRGVRWSDGVPFDGDDVVWTVQAILNPRNNEIGRDGWDLITKVDEPDKYTVVFHLRKPFSSYLPIYFTTGGANPCILPKHVLAKLPDINTAPYNSLPIGTGPFRFVEWRRQDHVTLEPNPYSWRGQPKLKRVIFKLIPDRNTLFTQVQTGEVDLWAVAPPAYAGRLKALSGHTTIQVPGYYFAHVDFNVQHPILADVRVRRALRFATDRATMLEKVQHGIGQLSETTIATSNPAYHKFDLIPYDLGAASKLLDEAGWKPGADGIRVKNGQRLSLVFSVYSGAPDTDTLIELLRVSWKAVGAEIEVRHYETSQFFALAQQGGIVYSGKFDATEFSWQGDPIGDISEQYGCDYIPPNGQNIPRWCNRAFDAAMAHFKLLYDPAERQPYSDEAERLLIDQVPTFVLWLRDDLYAYNSDLRGFAPNSISPFDDSMAIDI